MVRGTGQCPDLRGDEVDNMKRVEVVIDADGNSKVEAFGFSGSGCLDATKAIEDALGGVTEDVKKPEFRHGAGVSQKQKAGQ